MSKPSSTNYPRGFFTRFFISSPKYVNLYRVRRIAATKRLLARLRYIEAYVLLGGYSSEVPPLPIPNREVKLTNADGTAVFPWESR